MGYCGPHPVESFRGCRLSGLSRGLGGAGGVVTMSTRNALKRPYLVHFGVHGVRGRRLVSIPPRSAPS